MRYISVFSGIEAASVAWRPLGWEAVCFSEVDDFPSAVLAERFPDVPNLGDITKVDWSDYRGAADVVVGGSPCQSFSIAGNRTGLDGASGLMWEYVRCVRDVRPEWFVWENVPGALSSTHGEDFGCLLRSLDDLGYGLAWRVLDAQFFGVAQRRRRVFVVGHLGDQRSAEVLFEPESLRWDYPSSREKRQALAADAAGGAEAAGFAWHQGSDAGSIGFEPEQSPIRSGNPVGGGKGALVQEDMSATLSTANMQTLFQPVAIMPENAINRSDKAGTNGPMAYGTEDPSPTLRASNHVPAVAMATNQRGEVRLDGGDGDSAGAIPASRSGKQVQAALCMTDTQPNTAVDEELCGTLSTHSRKDPPVVCERRFVVRKLTPLECERLQGFPDGWTDVTFKGKKAPDTRRYKALGNSMAVPVMRWIGERIARLQ